MSDLPKLDVKTPADLIKPEKPEVLHGKPVEVPPGTDWQKLGTLTIWESLGRFFRSVSSVVTGAAQTISDVRQIVSGAKWVAIVLGLLIVAYIVIRLL
jgi:hypothetical protein